MDKICFRCEAKNSLDQTFCGACGSALALPAFITQQVDTRITEATRDRELVETESALRIFQKAYGWAKLVATLCGALLAILAIGATWRFIDLRSAADSAETAINRSQKSAEATINDTASKAQSDVVAKSQASLSAITLAADTAEKSSSKSQHIAEAQERSVAKQADSLRQDLSKQSGAVTRDVESARAQIKAASDLQPQMQSMQQQLREAQNQIQAQQKVITSSEDFAKQIFSSRVSLNYDLKTLEKEKFAVLDAKPDDGLVAVYLRLFNTPVNNTVEVQFNQIPAAPNSFIAFHNILVLFLQTAAEPELLSKPISLAYFPDKADKTIINKLEVRDGRVYADGESLPKFGQADPDFKGSKWSQMASPSPPTVTPQAKR